MQGVALFFFHANSCHEMDKTAPCSSAANAKKCCHIPEKSKGCCHNEKEYYKIDQDQQISHFQFEQLKPPVLLSALFFVLNAELPSDTHTLNYLTYKPPIVCKRHTDVIADIPPIKKHQIIRPLSAKKHCSG